jgi:exoribonuclease-2
MSEVNSAGEVISLPPHRTVIERVPIQENLRLHQIEDILTQEYFDQIEDPTTQANSTQQIPFAKDLSLLWRCAKVLFQKRQEMRVANGQKAEKLEQPDPSALLRDLISPCSMKIRSH